MRFDQDRRIKPWRRALLAGLIASATPVWGDGYSTNRASNLAITDVVLNSSSFEIPFNIDETGVAPLEVQLFVADGNWGSDSASTSGSVTNDDRASTWADGVGSLANWSTLPAGGNSGATGSSYQGWRLVDRQPPKARRFYVAGVPDGSYLFAIKTIGGSGQPTNRDPIRPELRVIVDTAQPEVQLAVDADFEGRLTAQFMIDDATEPKQISAHYVTDTTRQWRSADVQRTGNGGTLNFQPSDDWGQCSIRIRVIDQAGNESITNRMVKRPRIASSAATRFASGPTTFPGAPEMVELPPPSSPEQISNDFGLPAPTNAATDPGMAAAENLKPDSVKRPKTPAEAMRPLQRETAASAAGELDLNPPASGAANSVGASPRPETSFYTESIPVPSGQRDEMHNGEMHNGSAASPKSLSGPQQNSGMTSPPTSYVPPGYRVPSVETPPSRVSRNRAAAEPVDLEALAALSPVRYSNSLQFSLDYEIEAIGGRGVSDVELYGSIDGGRTWTRWGDDPDRATPFDIETNGEGTFGFCIVVVATNGLASARPLPGDAPDIVVVVDETAPRTSITGARYGEADRSGSLVIQYDCQDLYLMARPITLAFSETMEGPWTTIAAGLRNTGDYVWPADPQLPRQIYLRIDAIDQAGNVGSYVLDQPIDTQGLAPRARIRAFRPVSAPISVIP